MPDQAVQREQIYQFFPKQTLNSPGEREEKTKPVVDDMVMGSAGLVDQDLVAAPFFVFLVTLALEHGSLTHDG